MTESKSATAKGKAGRPKKSETPEFDFSSLEFTEAEMPKPANPFTKALTESYEYDTARKVTIPIEAQSRATNLLRRAAVELEIGVGIVAGEPLTNEDGSPTGMIDLVFKGKPRRKRKTDDAPAADVASAAEDTATTADGAPETSGEATDSPAAVSVPAGVQ
jgi:hypothetical protein